MSAALVILPRVWATADATFAGGQRLTALAPAVPFAATPLGRKAPHSLRLVSAEAHAETSHAQTAHPETSHAQTAHPQTAHPQTAHPQSVRTMPQPQLAFYRKYTEAMLQRYMKLSFEAGRVPSLLGRELFRGDVTHCQVRGFDDVVIFVHDVGKCLERLTPGLQHLVRRIALQGYSQGQTAAMLGISHRTVSRHYAEAIDRLTSLFLEKEILQLHPQSEEWT